MKVIIVLSTLFVVGSLIGYFIELFYRRFVSRKAWVNPGFLSGPYLPIYGVGVVILYGISNIDFNIDNIIINIIVKIFIIGFSMTLIEFLFGLISLKLFKIRLWDYSKNKGNIMGLICPLYSFFWLVIGSVYYFFINPFLSDVINWVSQHLIYSLFIGIVLGMIIADFAYSIHLLTKLKQFKDKEIIKFDEYRKEWKLKRMMEKNRKD